MRLTARVVTDTQTHRHTDAAKNIISIFRYARNGDNEKVVAERGSFCYRILPNWMVVMSNMYGAMFAYTVSIVNSD